MKISEKDRTSAFAVLAIVALAAVAYVFFLSVPAQQDKASDWQHFVSYVDTANQTAVFMDARGADADTARKIYQCGADLLITGRNLFGSKTLNTLGCDDTGCFYGQSTANASGSITLDNLEKQLASQPYILVKKGAPNAKIFEHHVEITLDQSYSQSCSFNVTLQ